MHLAHRSRLVFRTACSRRAAIPRFRTAPLAGSFVRIAPSASAAPRREPEGDRRRHTAPAAQPAPARATGGLRVLLAEDDAMVARSATTVLERLGHSVIHTFDGVAASRDIETRARDFDVLLIDVVMPRMSGTELAERARAAGFTGRIIMMSGLMTRLDADTVQRLRIHTFLTKPFLPADLERALAG